MREFIIKNGVLKKYRGGSTDVMIPDGVTEIGKLSFAGCKKTEHCLFLRPLKE